MTDVPHFPQYLKSFLALLVCIATSFVNYCISQAIDAYFLPLTIVSLFLFQLHGVKISVGAVSVIGVIDDIFSGSFLGTFPFIYAAMLYFVKTRSSPLSDKILILCFILAFLVINVLTFRSFCS